MTKVHIRSCVGCRQRRPKDTFLRIVRHPDGRIIVGAPANLPGRGAYLCRSEDCLRKASRGNRISKALRAPVDESAIAELTEIVTNKDAGNAN